MITKKARVFVHPSHLCALVVLIMSAQKALTETNCECLVLSKHSGVEWIGDCAGTTTEITSTTYTMETPPDVDETLKETQKPFISSLSNSQIKVTTQAVTLAPTSANLTFNPVTKNTSNISIDMSAKKITTKALITSKATTKDTLGKPGTPSTAIAKSSSEMPVSQPLDQGKSQREPVSERARADRITIGSAFGAVVVFGAVILAVVFSWKLGVLKKCREHSCNSSKVSSTDAESGDISQDGMKPEEKISKSL